MNVNFKSDFRPSIFAEQKIQFESSELNQHNHGCDLHLDEAKTH